MPRTSKVSSPPKVFDVIAPGKVAPTPTARPIIVTNRPIIKDPMAPANPPISQDAGESASHVGRTIVTTAPEVAAMAAKSAETIPKSNAEPALVAEKLKFAKDAALSPIDEAPAAALASPVASVSTADSIADLEDRDDGASSDKPQPGDAAAAAQAEKERVTETERMAQEKIIASGQYYLPIATDATRRREVRRAVLVLAIVIILALVWLDVAMDAGIVHIRGVQSLTHFFSVHP